MKGQGASPVPDGQCRSPQKNLWASYLGGGKAVCQVKLFALRSAVQLAESFRLVRQYLRDSRHQSSPVRRHLERCVETNVGRNAANRRTNLNIYRQGLGALSALAGPAARRKNQ